MHRLTTGFLGAAMLWGLAAADAAAFSVTYDQKMTTGGKVIPSKVKSRDGLFRIESVVDGMQSIVIRTAGGEIYQYMPAEQMAMKLPKFDGLSGPTDEAADYLSYLKQQNAQQLGTETVNGLPCEVYQFADASSGAMTKVWVWQGKQFPVKMEQDTPQGRVTAEFSNIQLGAMIPDAAFELPDGLQVMDMGAMGGLLGQMMQGGAGAAGAQGLDLEKLLGGGDDR